MWIHDFHSIGDCGHKRNFIYFHGLKKKLKSIRDFCYICEKEERFKILKYFKEVKEAK